ncbi:DUF732 domain-containing protein [Microbacterium foliorum]
MKNRIAALALLAALALTGCAGTAAPEGDERAASAESESAAPLEAETPAPEEAGGDDAEQAFLDNVRDNLPTPTTIPDATDEQLLAAGMEACERLRAGETSDTITLIEGEQKNGADIYADSGAIITAARLSLCPDQV